MKDIVFIEPNKINSIPFTTSDVIAEYAKINYRSVQRMIEKHIDELKTFGQVRFEITAVKYDRGTNEKKVYHLNEQQATLLITFLKNTVPVIKFKTELVKQFYLMRAELMKRQMLRTELKPIRRELTDVIQENPDKGKWSYKLYTDLAYKSVLGKNAAQIRKERNAGKNAVAVDYMTVDEIEKISKVQSQISVLHEMGYQYDEVKFMLTKRVSLVPVTA